MDSFATASALGSTSSSLLARLRDREPEAWQRFVRLYGPLVYGWCRQAGVQASDAADVVQEVLHAVAIHVASFRGEKPGDSFRGWLWTVTRNKLRDQFRRRKSHPQATGGSSAHEEFEQIPETPSEPSAGSLGDRTLLNRALDLVRPEFEERTWQAFWRMTVEGHSAADIASDLGLTKKAVRQAKYRVLQRLRRELKGLME